MKFAADRRRPDADLRERMVRGLVDEVIVAAGGIEREIRALKAAQAFADAHGGWCRILCRGRRLGRWGSLRPVPLSMPRTQR